MKILSQIGLIFGICWVSEIIESLLPIPFPASVIGMLLLLLLLLTKAVKLDGIRESANFLTANMAFLFLPNVVGVMEYGDLLKRYALPLFLISMISTVLTFSATALSVTAVLRLIERRKQDV